MTMDTLREFYVDELRDLYSAESQIINALPKMIDNAQHSELKSTLQEHLDVTRQQKDRLDRIFNELGERPTGHKCEAMQGILNEGESLMKSITDPSTLDAAMIASAQKVEHYEIAGYGCAKTYAQMLGERDAVDLLDQTLSEEHQADELLTQVAEGGVNQDAIQATAG